MPNCFELMTCPIDKPLQMFLQPFLLFFGDFFYIMVWGVFLSIIYLRTHNPIMTGLVGIIIGSFFTGTSAFTGGATQAFNIGYLLVGISVGITLFYLIRTKVNNP